VVVSVDALLTTMSSQSAPASTTEAAIESRLRHYTFARFGVATIKESNGMRPHFTQGAATAPEGNATCAFWFEIFSMSKYEGRYANPKGRLAALEIPVPPLPLQTTFAEQAQRIEATACALDAAAGKAEAMAAALSAEAFGCPSQGISSRPCGRI
jgi:hypothetical protein